MTLVYDKMRINYNLIIDKFQQVSERILELISDVLKPIVFSSGASTSLTNI
jgi:hypothetical protein